MTNENGKPEFWETNFIEKQEMWGFGPSNSAVLTKELPLSFAQNRLWPDKGCR